MSTATSCRIQVVADLSPVSATVDFVAGLHTDVHGSTMPNFNIHKLTGFVYNYKQKRYGGLAVGLDCSAAAVPKIKSKF